MSLNRLGLAMLLSVLPAVQLSVGFAQTGGARGSVPASSGEGSHRLLPADAEALMRLRERTELLRALGMMPGNAAAGRSAVRRPSEKKPAELSPQLFELLRQMAPQQLPGQAGEALNSAEEPRLEPTDRAARNSQPLERLAELLGKEELSSFELSQVQELMQSLAISPPGPQPGSGTGLPGKGLSAGKVSSRERRQSASDGSAISENQGASGERSETATQPGFQANSGLSESLAGVRRAGTADAGDDSRQRMLRQAFGLDPSSPRPAASSSNGSGAANLPDARQDRTETGRRPGHRGMSPNPSRPGNTAGIGSSNPLSVAPEESGDQIERSERDRTFDTGSQEVARQVEPTGEATVESDSRSGNRSPSVDSGRAGPLSEIASSAQPAWQKLQQIARLARQQTAEQSRGQRGGESDVPFGLSNGLTQKLATVVQSAAEATVEAVAELRNDGALPDRRGSDGAARRPGATSEIEDWASSMNDWVSRLPEGGQGDLRSTEGVHPGSVPGNAASPKIAAWLIAVLIAGGASWILRRHFGATGRTEVRGGLKRQTDASTSERDRLIAAFHELIRESQCGSEDWWHHARAVRQLAAQQPQLATSLQSLAAIYEQARYAPDSEPSPGQIAAARAALKRCGRR